MSAGERALGHKCIWAWYGVVWRGMEWHDVVWRDGVAWRTNRPNGAVTPGIASANARPVTAGASCMTGARARTTGVAGENPIAAAEIANILRVCWAFTICGWWSEVTRKRTWNFAVPRSALISAVTRCIRVMCVTKSNTALQVWTMRPLRTSGLGKLG